MKESPMAELDLVANQDAEAKPVVVRDIEEFRRMPDEYKELVIHQLRAHTEGELTGADDYTSIFFPMAPDAYERQVCCERAWEELDHYLRGARVLDEIGIDTSYMLKQNIEQREYYRTQGVRKIPTWVARGLFSFVGEQAILMTIEEMAESSYLPIRDMCKSVIIDEYIHVAHGYRITQEYCKTDEGRAEVQKSLDNAWPVSLDLFGRKDSERSKLYLKWGLRKYSNEEARQRYIKFMVPRLELLGLTVPDNTARRQFL
jgi:ring-1,2-phenylacetyl-CoA epoxidase subunit PaaA